MQLKRSLLLLFAFSFLGGCASQSRVLGDGRTIDEIHFKGNDHISKGRLLAHLHLAEDSMLSLAPGVPYDKALVAVDLERLLDLYRSQGYYDARLKGVEVYPDDDEVSLTISISEGKAVLLEKVEIRWVDNLLSPELRAEVESSHALKVGEPFAENHLNDAVGALRLALLERGYPLAVVQSHSEVDLDTYAAKVELHLLSGAHATIKAVVFEGVESVPEAQLQREVRFALGEPYSPLLIAQIEQALKAMRIFRWVATRPPVSVEAGETTLTVRVSEAEPQSIRVGGQIALETIRWQEQLRVDYTHTNLFGELTRLDLAVIGGWAQLPNPFDPKLDGPVIEIEPRFTKKALFEDQLLWSWIPSYEVNVQEGYQYQGLGSRLSVNRWFGHHFMARVEHELKFVDFFNVSPDLDQKSSLLGRDYRDPYLLSTLGVQLQTFWVDDILQPHDGAILEGRYWIAAESIGSDFTFHKVLLRARAYWRITQWLQLASRVQSGLIIPFGPQGGAPFNLRYYLGGSNSVRGFGSRRLSPRLEECEGEQSCSSVPVGGYSMIQGNLELRFWIFPKFALVAFGDMGDVQADDLKYLPEEWNFTAGPGLRVKTPIGLARLDAGFRINDPGVFDEPMWALYFGIGEAF